MDAKDIIQSCIAAGVLVVAAVSANLAIRTLKFNAKTKSAEFLMTLHKSFFVETTYKTVRDTIDNDSAVSQAEIKRYVADEPAEFTDFLNFFELVTYLCSNKTLKRKQVEALLGYYLQRLNTSVPLRSYIMDKNKGFEHLAAFLRRRETEQSERTLADG